MKYTNVISGKFVDRPNRFTAHVEIDGVTETVHVKNTGRLSSLLIPGNTVSLEKSANPKRKNEIRSHSGGGSKAWLGERGQSGAE
ncbi:MAG: hypothetical protein V8R09_09000 [Coprococcus sp.]